MSFNDPIFDENIIFRFNKIEPSVAGPKRPQDKIYLKIFLNLKQLMNQN